MIRSWNSKEVPSIIPYTVKRASGPKRLLCKQQGWNKEFYLIYGDVGECIRYVRYINTGLKTVPKAFYLDHKWRWKREKKTNKGWISARRLSKELLRFNHSKELLRFNQSKDLLRFSQSKELLQFNQSKELLWFNQSKDLMRFSQSKELLRLKQSNELLRFNQSKEFLRLNQPNSSYFHLNVIIVDWPPGTVSVAVEMDDAQRGIPLACTSNKFTSPC